MELRIPEENSIVDHISFDEVFNECSKNCYTSTVPLKSKHYKFVPFSKYNQEAARKGESDKNVCGVSEKCLETIKRENLMDHDYAICYIRKVGQISDGFPKYFFIKDYSKTFLISKK